MNFLIYVNYKFKASFSSHGCFGIVHARQDVHVGSEVLLGMFLPT